MGSLESEILKWKNRKRKEEQEKKIQKMKEKFPVSQECSTTGKDQKNSQDTIVLHIGFDFGTSFTKVCVRDLGAEESVLINLYNHKDGLLPVKVYLDSEKDSLDIEQPLKSRARYRTIEYLKMILAEMEDIPSELSMEDIEAIALWYFVLVIDEVKSRFPEQENTRCKGRILNWTGISMGVPVEYFASSIKDRFQTLLQYALFVSNNKAVIKPERTLSFYKTYLGTLKKRAPGELHDEDEPVDVYPEIVAAINSFVHNRDMRSGYYAYFDIGGGTLDGIVFDYNDVDGRKEIDVITASVQPLGVEKVCSGLLSEAAKEPNREENHRKVNSVMTAPGELPATVAVTIDMHKNDQSRAIKRHVAGIIVPIKMNDTMLRLDKQDVIPLYLGGGGAGSHWYVQRITATYKDHQHARCNIPPYRERRIEEVSDLKMEENRASVNRFLVAYGLSVPRDENLDITGLPDKHENDSREIIRKKIDSEAIQMEIYGEIN